MLKLAAILSAAATRLVQLGLLLTHVDEPCSRVACTCHTPHADLIQTAAGLVMPLLLPRSHTCKGALTLPLVLYCRVPCRPSLANNPIGNCAWLLCCCSGGAGMTVAK